MRIYIADASRAGWKRVANLLSEIAGIEVVGNAASAEVALAEMHTLRPELLILDIDMPPKHGIALLHAILRDLPALKVIILTDAYCSYYRRVCIGAGAMYFFDKSAEFHHLPLVVRELMGEPHQHLNHSLPTKAS